MFDGGDGAGDGPVLPRRRRRLRPRRAARPAATSTCCCCTRPGASEAAARRRARSGTRSGTPGCGSTTACARSARPGAWPARTSRSCSGCSTPASSPATPSLRRAAAAAVLADWRAMADRRLPDLHELVLRAAPSARRAAPPARARPQGGLRRPARRHGPAGGRRLLGRRRPARRAGRTRSAFLLDVRDALHRVTGRSADRLVLQEQDAVADELVGVPDADALLRAVSKRRAPSRTPPTSPGTASSG